MKRMVAGLLCGLCLLAGCAGPQNVADLSSRNRERLDDLSIGMSRSQVARMMGDASVDLADGAVVANPYRREAALGPDGSFLDVLYYCTDIAGDSAGVTQRHLTPIVFRDGHVIGWGWSFLVRRAPPAALTVRAID